MRNFGAQIKAPEMHRLVPLLLLSLLFACGKKQIPEATQQNQASAKADAEIAQISLRKDISLEGNVSIIPKPALLIQNPGSFKIHPELAIYYNSPEAKPAAELFNDLYKKATGKTLLISENTEPAGRKNGIYFNIEDIKDNKPEAYKLFSAHTYAKLSANQGAGLFYAVQSLRQLMPPAFNLQDGNMPDEWEMPAVSITDAPRFSWRGMLLDCSRHFMDKDFVKRYIDLLAFHKMNTLHWHITEDQGWRIAIDQYPKLTEIGAWREGENGKPYGGFYTKEDIREIVAYADERHINVVPEIEMPGHSQAALAAYPEYSCTGGPFKVETEWGVFREIYCAGNEQTFEFLFKVLDEVMELFPSPWIHLGADEVPKYRWEHCDKCQARIKNEGLKDEHELQAYFLRRVADHLLANGRTIIGWDEILDGDLPDGAIVQSWRGMDGARKAIEAGHQAIVSPTSHAYFDYDVKAIDLQKVYSFKPIPEGITGRNSLMILGGECNMWTERAPQEKVDSKVFPRILAMSEVLWTPEKYRNYNDFYFRVQHHYKQLDAMEVDYGFETLPVRFDAKMQNDGQLKLDLIPGGQDVEILYQLAESQEPIKFTDPLLLNKSAEIVAQAKKDSKNYGEPASLRFDKHLANAKIPIIQKKYSESYTGGGATALTNGLRGSLDFRDGNWQGYQLHDLDCTIDLGSLQNISKIESSYYQYNNSWIFFPTEVTYYTSVDGQEYKKLEQNVNDTPARQRGKSIKSFAVETDPQQARYIKVVAKNIGTCPDWHEAAGGHAWLFVDEIIIQ